MMLPIRNGVARAVAHQVPPDLGNQRNSDAAAPGLPFTRWSLRKLAAYLADGPRPVRIGRERLRQVLLARGISFQRTRTWKESAHPG
jgi:hypothetical protein